MGIRIHKAIGWGLDDVGSKDYKIEDSRFKPWDEISDRIDNFNPTDFKQYIIDHRSELEHDLNKLNMLHILDFILKLSLLEFPCVYSPEYGLDNVMLFIPPENKSWDRFDDIIDYYESKKGLDGGPINYVQKLETGGIYPYLGWYRKTWAPHADFIKQECWDKWAQLDCVTYYALAKEGSLVSEYVKEYYRPAIADSVAILTRYLDIFVDWERTVQELTPMIYTYWS